MYYQFDSRLNLPAIKFDDDRIVVAGKEYYYTELKDIDITKAPLLATYGIMELRTEGRPAVPVPFAKADLHRLRTAVQEAKHLIQMNAARQEALNKAAEAAIQPQTAANTAFQTVTQKSGTAVTKIPETAAADPAQSFVKGGQTAAEISAAAVGTPEPSFQNQAPRPALDPYEEMKKLKELLDLDIITSEEFARKKKELLGL